MSKKYVVSYRIGTDLLAPEVCNTQDEAEEKAATFLCDACLEAWDRIETEEAPDIVDELQEWAEDHGYVYSDSFFWDGSGDGYEAMVTEFEDPGFKVNVVTGDVFINDKFVSQLCWTPDAVGMAIASWLEEQEAQDEEESDELPAPDHVPAPEPVRSGEPEPVYDIVKRVVDKLREDTGIKRYRVWAEGKTRHYLDVDARSEEEAKKIAAKAEEGSFMPALDDEWVITEAVEL